MRQGFHVFALLISAALTSPSWAATNLAAISTSGKSVLIIDGVACDRVLSWEGGDIRGSVVTQALATGGPATKTVGNSAVAPLALQVSLPLSSQLATLINDLCSGRFTRHTVQLVDYNSTGVATAAFELSNAMLSEVTFPAFDATTSVIEPMKLVFAAEQSRPVGAPGTTSVSLATRSVSTFQLSVDGVDASRTMRIEPITVTLHTSTESPGDARAYTTTPSSVEFSTLRITFSATSATSWNAWWTDFVLNGHAMDENEKNAAVKLIDSSGAPMNIALNFTHVGILRVSRPPATSGVATKLDAEMYFEGLSLGSPTATSSASSASTATDTTASTDNANSATSADTSATDAAATNATNSPPPSTESATAASTGTAGPSAPTALSSPSIASRTISTTEVPLVSSTTTQSTALKTVLNLNPDDVGSRDPAQFPRVEGLTRTYYSGTFQTGYTSEQATYTSTDPIEQLVARVDAAAKAAGWTMTTVTESAPDGEKRVAEAWVKGGASVSLSYQQPVKATGTQMSVVVYVQLPPAS